MDEIAFLAFILGAGVVTYSQIDNRSLGQKWGM
jgi:hypothetical protein